MPKRPVGQNLDASSLRDLREVWLGSDMTAGLTMPSLPLRYGLDTPDRYLRPSSSAFSSPFRCDCPLSIPIDTRSDKLLIYTS